MKQQASSVEVSSARVFTVECVKMVNNSRPLCARKNFCLQRTAAIINSVHLSSHYISPSSQIKKEVFIKCVVWSLGGYFAIEH